MIEARIRERVAHWARDHANDGAQSAGHELEADIAKLLEQMLELAEQHLQPQEATADPLDEAFAARRRRPPDEPPDDRDSLRDP